jgi:predicted ATP-dependent serine protease
MTTKFVCVHCGTLYGQDHEKCPRCGAFEARIWQSDLPRLATPGIIIKDKRVIAAKVKIYDR